MVAAGESAALAVECCWAGRRVQSEHSRSSHKKRYAHAGESAVLAAAHAA